MDAIDLLIILCCLVSLVIGFRNGAIWVALSSVTLVAGILLGALIAPAIVLRFHGIKPGFQSLVLSGVFLLTAFVVQALGTALALLVTKGKRVGFARLNAVGGGVLAVATTLIVVWFVGITLADSQWYQLDNAIDNSAILRTLSSIAPTPPSFIIRFEALLNASAFTSPFATVIPDLGPTVPLPSSIDTVGVLNASSVTGKLYSFGCPDIDAGSAWPIALHYYITNAHVVAGGTKIILDLQNGTTWPATVVTYDPNEDIALLYVPGSNDQGLPVANVAEQPATPTAFIGFPKGESERIAPAAIRGSLRAVGFNLYRSEYVTRSIYDVEGDVQPGDSGGPLVTLNGTVVGIIFARSAVVQNVGYALPTTAILPIIRSGLHSTVPVSTEGCLTP